MEAKKQTPKIILRYDGRYDWIPGDSRTWTILSHLIDAAGADRKGSSLIHEGLINLLRDGTPR